MPVHQPQPSSNDGNLFFNSFREWAVRTPYVTRCAMIALIVSYSLSWLMSTEMLIGNTPFFSVFGFEIYRLVMSPFAGDSLINLALVSFSFPSMGVRIETCLGSSAYLCLIGIVILITNGVFALVCIILYSSGIPEAIFYHCSGFWIVLFGIITMECTQAPDQPRRMMMIPVDIPGKYYPLLTYVLFYLFEGPKLSYAIAIGAGYLYQRGFLNCIRPSTCYLENLESPSGVLHSLSRSKGWVLAGAAIGHDGWIAAHGASVGGDQLSILRAWGSGLNKWAAHDDGSIGADAGSQVTSPNTPRIGTISGRHCAYDWEWVRIEGDEAVCINGICSGGCLLSRRPVPRQTVSRCSGKAMRAWMVLRHCLGCERSSDEKK